MLTPTVKCFYAVSVLACVTFALHSMLTPSMPCVIVTVPLLAKSSNSFALVIRVW